MWTENNKGGDRREVRKNRKLKRNKGEAYLTSKGKQITSRLFEPLDACRMKCNQRVNDETRQILFHEYWSMGDRDKRADF